MESDRTEDYYWYWLCSIPGVGAVKLRALLDEYGGAKEVYRHEFRAGDSPPVLTKTDLKLIEETKRDTRLYEDFCALKDKNIRFIHMNSPEYPDRLSQIYDAPAGLYVRGSLPPQDGVTVAVIGARGCTEYGRSVAYNLGKNFAYMGIHVVSGMALGIDAAGQSGCIDAGGMSVAVLGCGVDICYPRENIELYRKLSDKGCIISEYAPGTKPCRGTFPVRNRIISGLADVVVVVEARHRSGSLITVDLALEQNKEIMAVPGRIDDALSVGCNELLKMGAAVITCADDIRQIESVKRILEQRSEQKKNIFKNSQNLHGDDSTKSFDSNFYTNQLASEKNMVYSTVNLYPKDMDTIMRETGLDISEVSRQLLELQLSGAVRESGKNCYVRSSLKG